MSERDERPERFGREPEREFCWSCSVWRDAREERETGRVPEIDLSARFMAVTWLDWQLMPVQEQ